MLDNNQVSVLECRARDAVLDRVRELIEDKRVTAQQIAKVQKSFRAEHYARIGRGEYDEFSLRRALLIAEGAKIRIDFLVAQAA